MSKSIKMGRDPRVSAHGTDRAVKVKPNAFTRALVESTTGCEEKEEATNMFNRNRQKGFTLIELLIVVAIIGIIAAILIPNLLDALQKAKQKRTVADVRNAGTAWMSWLTDQVGAASAGSSKTYPANLLKSKAYGDVYAYLHPGTTFFYMQEVPELDGWRYKISFAQADNLLDSSVLMIGAPARDNTFTPGFLQPRPINPFIATDYNQDIVWADGYFVSWPEGTKR